MAAQLQGLAEVALAVNRALSVSEILRTVVDHARAIVGAEVGLCSLRVPGTGAADGWPQDHVHTSPSSTAAGSPASRSALRGRARALCHPDLVGLVCATNDVVRVSRDDVGTLPDAAPSLRCWLAAPLVARDGRNLGILQLADRREGDFTDEDEAILVQLAQMASVAVEKVQLLEGARHHVAQLRDLTSASVVINSPTSLDDVLHHATTSAARIVGTRAAITSLTRGGEWSVGLHSRYGQAAASPRRAELDGVGAAIHDLVCRTGEAIRLTRGQLGARPEWPATTGEAPGWLAAPLLDRNGGTLGVIQLGDKVHGEFDETDEAVLVQLAQMASVAIEKVDLTQQVAAQQAARFREELLSGISHDMQTPLATIVGLSELLAEDPPEDVSERETIHATISRQARNLRGLVQQFLDFSRLESDRPLVLRPRPTDVVAAIDRTVQLFEHHREIVVGAAQGLPPALADPDRLDQILVNLVSNAIKYSEGPVRVVARVEDGAILIDVVDEGPGIDEDEVAQLFVKFHRGRSAAGTSGTGLGLYISRALIHAQGGSLSVHSNPGVGSRFQIRLPVAGPS